MAAAKHTKSSLQERTLKRRVVKQVSLRYLLSLPAGYERAKTRRWPLILFLHDAGERGDDISRVNVHGIPRGPLLLRDWSLRTLKAGAAHKLAAIEGLLEAYPTFTDRRVLPLPPGRSSRRSHAVLARSCRTTIHRRISSSEGLGVLVLLPPAASLEHRLHEDGGRRSLVAHHSGPHE